MPRAKYERRTVHLRALLVLLLGGGVLAGALYLTHMFQVRRNAQALLAQADHAEAEGQLGQAADYIWQYLGLIRRGDEADKAFARYALLFEKQAKSPRQRLRALFLLEQVLRRGKGDEGQGDVRRLAAQVAVGLRLVKEAQHHLDELRRRGDRDDSLLLLEARCAFLRKDFDAALEGYARYAAKAPADMDAWREYLAVAGGKARSAGAEVAEEVVAQMLKANPRSVEAREAAARYFLGAGSADKADEQARFALETLGAKGEGLLLLAADAARARGQDEEAGRRLSRALELHPKSATVRLAAARLEAALGRRSEALNLLEPLRRNPPALMEERWDLGALLADLGDTAGAEEALQRLGGPEAGVARRLLQAVVHIRKKEYGEGRVLLEKLRLEKLPAQAMGRQVDLLLADCDLALGIPEQAAEASRRAMAANPADRLGQAGRARLAQALAISGKADQAITEYRQLGDQGPAARLRQARLMLAKQQGQPEKERDWKELEKLLDEFPADQKDNAEVVLIRAQMLLVRGQGDAARRLVEAARDRAPTEVGPWLFLAEQARLQGKPEAALAVLQEAERRGGRKVEWELARVRYLGMVGGDDGRKKLQAIASDLGRWTGEDHDRLLASLGGALGQVGDSGGAERLWREVAQRQPRNLPVRLLLLDRAAQAGRADEVRGLAGEIEKAEGSGGPMGAYAKAVACWLAAARGDRAALAEAQQHLNRAGTLRPNWDHVATLEGDLELFQGRKQAAAAKYRAAIDRGERRLAVWRRAAHVLFDLRQYGEAEALLRRLPEQTRLQGDLGRMSAVLALTDADEAADPKEKARQALEVARKVVQGGPGDYRDQLWLAQMAWRADQRAEAERAVRKGRELAPNEPVTLVALISVLAQVDRDRARRELADAERTWKGSRDARILMVCHETVGQAKEAEAYARQAVAEQGSQAAVLLEVAAFHARNGRADQAEKLWRAVVNLAGAPDDAVRAARRSLALDLAVRQTYPTYQEALALIERNLDKAEAVEDRLVKALVLATQAAQRAEAIKLFEALSGPTSSTPDGARLLLAQLYEADGRWPQAQAVLRALVKGDNRNPRQLAYAARAFLRHGEPEEVGPLLGRLDAVAGGAFEAVELRARWLNAAGKKAEARALLERHAAAKEDQAGQAALTLAGLGEDASAEKILRQLAANPKRPEGLVLLAQYLGLRKRTTEALAVCERAWGTALPQVVATASVAVLRAGSPGDAEKAAVAERVRAALKGQPGAVPLLLALAEVEELRGRSDQVAELYRQVLKVQPGNAVALNNLAYYLAMRHGDPGQGLRLIDQLVKEAGPVGEVLDTRGLILLAAGRAEEAVKDFQAAVKQSPDGVKYFHLAQAHLAAGERDAGKSAWLRAQAAGLKEEALHPLERPAFRSFAGEFASN